MEVNIYTTHRARFFTLTHYTDFNLYYIVKLMADQRTIPRVCQRRRTLFYYSNITFVHHTMNNTHTFTYDHAQMHTHIHMHDTYIHKLLLIYTNALCLSHINIL